jgi:hypothetical protein
MTNRLLPINDLIDRLVNANGNQKHIRAAVVEFDSNINEAIAKPFAAARKQGFPTGWRAIDRKNANWTIISAEGQIFNSVKAGKAFLAVIKSNDKLTVENKNALALGLPADWTASKVREGIKKSPWICIDSKGVTFPDSKSALDSLKEPAAASSANAADAPFKMNDTSLAVHLKKVETLLSQAMVMMSEMRRERDDAKPAAKKSDPSSTSAVAVTVKKDKGRKRSHSDSNDESYSPDY